MERKLQISDLSIGDWVMVKGKAVKVESLGKIRNYVELEGSLALFHIKAVQPIPITPEILEKNGWLPPRKAIELDTWWWTNGTDTAIEANEYNGEWHLTIIEQKEIQYRNRVGIGLKYLHELQHAIRLAGIEKEIEL